MAAIDHTVIVFKNGKWLEDVDYNSLPFEFGRDGNIHSVEMSTVKSQETDGWCITWDVDALMTSIWDEIKWYQYEYDAWYMREGFSKLTRFNWRQIKCLFKWITRKLSDPVYGAEVGTWQDTLTEVYIWHEPMKESYVSFYRNKLTDDTYIVLGGYGHHANVYAHFMHRGYGKEFERKMAQEAFDWCSRDVLRCVADYIRTDLDAKDELYRALQKVFCVGREEEEAVAEEKDVPFLTWVPGSLLFTETGRELGRIPDGELGRMPGQAPGQEGTDAQ